jgi:hypothetical protein
MDGRFASVLMTAATMATTAGTTVEHELATTLIQA